MSTAAIPMLMSVDEFLLHIAEREEGETREELIDGEIVLSPNAKSGHSEIVSRIFKLLFPLDNQGFIVLGEVACRLTNWSLPNTDVCVIKRDRWEAVKADDFIQEAPALAIEVISPGNRKKKRLQKAEGYLEYGAEQVWMVYPKTQTVNVLTRDGDREARLGETIEFHDLRIALTDIFEA